MTVNDYWIAKMAATDAGGATTEEETAMAEKRDQRSEEQPRSVDGRAIANPEIVEDENPQVNENFRPVADPENYDGEVHDYNPATDPEPVPLPEPQASDEDVAAAPQQQEIPSGEEPVPAEKVEPERTSAVVDPLAVAWLPGNAAEAAGVDPDRLEHRTHPEDEESADPARDNVPAETVTDDDTVEDTSVAREEPAEWENSDAQLVPEEQRPQHTITGTITGTITDDDSDDDTYEADKAAATEKVPTSANTKQEIRDYLTYEHGVDPDDLKDQSKVELLDLVNDLAE